ncbi:MAG TPA: hypothetical protein VG325_19925 [Solirubrobacteraceae bacterium]|nr:hypothetical protein [Solirubrobacteraceae bacterium]
MLQPRTELTALAAAGGAAPVTVVDDAAFGVGAVCELVELVDGLGLAARGLEAADGLWRPRAVAEDLRWADLPAARCFPPAARCFPPAAEQLVGVAALPVPGAGSLVVGDFFFGGHVGVVLPADDTGAWAAPVVVVGGAAPVPAGAGAGVAVLGIVADAGSVVSADVAVVEVAAGAVAVVEVGAGAVAVVAVVAVPVSAVVDGAVVVAVVVAPAGGGVAAGGPSAAVAPAGHVGSAVDSAMVLARIDRRGRRAPRRRSVRKIRPMRNEPGRPP